MKTILHIVQRALCPIVWIVFMLLTGLQLSAQILDYGKSYINVTKGLNGGTVETGDTLEIRASFVVRSGTYDSCRFQDAVPAGTSYIPGTIAVLTNEGKIYKSFTDVYADDCGWITGSNITINLGFKTSASPATPFKRGRVGNTFKPSFYGSACIMICSYRIKVTAATYSSINTGGGNITSKNGAAAIVTNTFPSNPVMIYPNYGICSNTVGTNALGTESNGTFGSGKPRNRAASSANVPAGYTFTYFDLNAPQDYFYGIANNTSTRSNYTTLNTWAIPDGSAPTHRVFTVWDIIGDHTGAASPTAGNPPADTVANPNAGYMLVINAAYRIDSAFQQTITGLCPNTYYEISCWMRNICSRCGCDSNGVGPGAGYIPSGPNDSSGVRPNLTFEIDGFDYYTTGNLTYSGQWVKKGFTFLTGAAQTSFTMKFFNNAPGGGGNDWALDDISVATCSPNMQYAPTINPIVCDSNSLVIADTVRSYFNNYTYYKWQRSADGGATWSDVTPATGPVVPTWNGTAWQYISTYTIPSTMTYMSNSGDLYRLIVATTVANLSDVNCRFTDVGDINLHVITCGPILATDLLSFNGNIRNGLAVLNWTTSKEQEALTYYIEKSTDGINFRIAGTISSYNNPQSDINAYSYTDPEAVIGQVYYRVRLLDQSRHSKVSRTIQLSTTDNKLAFAKLINPFNDQLHFDLITTENTKMTASLIDQYGMTLKRQTADLASGLNSITLDNTGSLPSGIYILRIQSGSSVVQKRVVKQTR